MSIKRNLNILFILLIHILFLPGCGKMARQVITTEDPPVIITREELIKNNEEAAVDAGQPSLDSKDVGDYLDTENLTDYQRFMQENLEECKEMLAAEQDPTQQELESDTLQWINATYALLTEYNGDDRKLVGGRKRTADNAVFMRYQLLDGWGIYDRKSSDEVIFRLEQSGHRQGYKDLIDGMKEIGLLELSDEEFNTTIRSVEEFDYDTKNRLLTTRIIYQKYGDKGLLAWDYCRINQLYGWGYVSGYYTLNEALENSLEVSRILQDSFESWDEMADNYLLGLQYWKNEPSDFSFIMGEAEKRRNIFENLKTLPDSPYSLDFKMKLEKNWETPKSNT